MSRIKEFVTERAKEVGVVASGLGLAALLAVNQQPSKEAPKTEEVAAVQEVAAPAAAAEQQAPEQAATPEDPAKNTAHKLAKVAIAKQQDNLELTGAPVSDQQVEDNTYSLVKAFEKEGIASEPVLAYMMATMEHETAATMAPVREINGSAQAERLGYGGGTNFYGRGYVQLTHKNNYAKVGESIGLGDVLVKDPDKALEPPVAADVMADFFKNHGVAEDAQTGDFVRARDGVNGDDDAEQIAGYANLYLDALK